MNILLFFSNFLLQKCQKSRQRLFFFCPSFLHPNKVRQIPNYLLQEIYHQRNEFELSTSHRSRYQSTLHFSGHLFTRSHWSNPYPISWDHSTNHCRSEMCPVTSFECLSCLQSQGWSWDVHDARSSLPGAFNTIRCTVPVLHCICMLIDGNAENTSLIAIDALTISNVGKYRKAMRINPRMRIVAGVSVYLPFPTVTL